MGKARFILISALWLGLGNAARAAVVPIPDVKPKLTAIMPPGFFWINFFPVANPTPNPKPGGPIIPEPGPVFTKTFTFQYSGEPKPTVSFGGGVVGGVRPGSGEVTLTEKDLNPTSSSGTLEVTLTVTKAYAENAYKASIAYNNIFVLQVVARNLAGSTGPNEGIINFGVLRPPGSPTNPTIPPNPNPPNPTPNPNPNPSNPPNPRPNPTPARGIKPIVPWAGYRPARTRAIAINIHHQNRKLTIGRVTLGSGGKVARVDLSGDSVSLARGQIRRGKQLILGYSAVQLPLNPVANVPGPKYTPPNVSGILSPDSAYQQRYSYNLYRSTAVGAGGRAKVKNVYQSNNLHRR